MISLYGSQILKGLAYLHERKIYHLHLHSGNVLLDEKNNEIKITGIENFVCDFSIRQENYFNFIFEYICLQGESESNNGIRVNNSDLFTEIYRNQFNIFEKLDIISFGRILYEMVIGKELNCAYPDELEYKSMDEEISKILSLIFLRKRSKYNNISNNYKCSLPEINAKDLLNHEFFKLHSEKNEKTKKKDVFSYKKDMKEESKNYSKFVKIIFLFLEESIFN